MAERYVCLYSGKQVGPLGRRPMWGCRVARPPSDLRMPRRSTVVAAAVRHGSGKTMVFREYIGAQDKGVRFEDVHVNPAVEVHFILDYNVDNPAQPTPNNGHFNVFWDKRNLTPAAVAAIKQKYYPKVKVMLSVGGATLLDKEVKFAPISNERSWVENAFRSLTRIIDEYGLDGIDINYESFVGDDAAKFARCIGRLLQRLKARDSSIITSIAPYKWIDKYYETLWGVHKSEIDYVNYQFYADRTDLTEAEYIDNYNLKRQTYGGKLLAAINTSNPKDVQIVDRRRALGACRTLAEGDHDHRSLQAGIFIWSADSSFYNNWPQPTYEQQAQEIVNAAGQQ